MKTEHQTLVLEVADRLRLLFRSTQQDLNELFADDMTLSEFAVLHILYHAKQPLMASELADFTRVTSSHITAVTDKLYKKGFIARERSDSDRRIVYVRITESGEAIAGKLDQMRTDYYNKKFACLNDAEMEQIKVLIDRILS